MRDIRVPRSRTALPSGPRLLWVYGLYAALAAFCVFVLVRNLDSPNDYANFVPFGAAALEGLDPYAPEVVERFGVGHLWSTWPPSFAPIAVLLVQLQAGVGAPATIAIWQGANLLGLAMLLALAVRWLHRRRLGLRPGPRKLPLYSAPALAGLVVPFRLVLGNFEHSQSNLLFLGLAAAGFWLFHDRRRWSGGLAIGLATAFKATPLILLPYLGWRGRWKDLGAAVVGCAVTWVALPALLVGLPDLVEWYRSWIGFVRDLHVPVSQMNQSLQGTLSRLLELGGAVGAGAVSRGAAPLHVPGGPFGGRGASTAVAALAVLLGLAAAFAFGRPGRQVARRREALELGVAFAALALFSPIGWKFHFVGLVVLAAALYARTDVVSGRADPGSAAARPRNSSGREEPPSGTAPPEGGAAPTAGSGPSVRMPGPPSTSEDEEAPERSGSPPRLSTRLLDPVWVVLALAALAINGTATGLVGDGAADLAEHYGVVTWSALALVLVALWRLWREREAAGSG